MFFVTWSDIQINTQVQTIILINLMKTIKYAIRFPNKTVLHYNELLDVAPEHTNSVIKTLASHLLQFQQIYPPMAPQRYQSCKDSILQYYNPFYQEWSEYLVKCVFNNYAILHDTTFHIVIPIQHLSAQPTFNGSQLFTKIQSQETFGSNHECCSKTFQLPQVQKRNLNCCILNFHPIQTDVQFAPRKNNVAIILGLFFNNQQWHKYNVTVETPTLDSLMTFDRIILTGSKLSVIDRIPAIQTTIHRVMEAYKANQKLKIVGFCFGHQLVSQYFKAPIVKKQYVSGVQTIIFNKEMALEYDFLKAISEVGELQCCQLHQDYVQEVPVGFKLLASSASCKVQSLISEDGRILTSQFHSEYLDHFICISFKQVRLFTSNPSFGLTYKQAASAQQKRRTAQDSTLFVQAIRLFFV